MQALLRGADARTRANMLKRDHWARAMIGRQVSRRRFFRTVTFIGALPEVVLSENACKY